MIANTIADTTISTATEVAADTGTMVVAETVKTGFFAAATAVVKNNPVAFGVGAAALIGTGVLLYGARKGWFSSDDDVIMPRENVADAE